MTRKFPNTTVVWRLVGRNEVKRKHSLIIHPRRTRSSRISSAPVRRRKSPSAVCADAADAEHPSLCLGLPQADPDYRGCEDRPEHLEHSLMTSSTGVVVAHGPTDYATSHDFPPSTVQKWANLVTVSAVGRA